MQILLTDDLSDTTLSEISKSHFVAERGDGVWNVLKNKLNSKDTGVWNTSDIADILCGLLPKEETRKEGVSFV